MWNFDLIHVFHCISLSHCWETFRVTRTTLPYKRIQLKGVYFRIKLVSIVSPNRSPFLKNFKYEINLKSMQMIKLENSGRVKVSLNSTWPSKRGRYGFIIDILIRLYIISIWSLCVCQLELEDVSSFQWLFDSLELHNRLRKCKRRFPIFCRIHFVFIEMKYFWVNIVQTSLGSR